MGIGIWSEMFIGDPVSYLYKHTDPRGSLAANVSNATVRCLSNLKLADILKNRHAMFAILKAEKMIEGGGGYYLGAARQQNAQRIIAAGETGKQISPSQNS